MLSFIESQPNIVERILRHLETPAIVDLLVRIIQLDEYAPGAGVLDVCVYPNFAHCRALDETTRSGSPGNV